MNETARGISGYPSEELGVVRDGAAGRADTVAPKGGWVMWARGCVIDAEAWDDLPSIPRRRTGLGGIREDPGRRIAPRAPD